ncbi:MAG TPA: hypothetical protein ENH85_09125 [Candidatus Scalindua sp.]|nr:hypothetical protein [Candidatus Scalindua sp.]
MKTIKPIILSYNLPKETDQIHDKLVNDGFKDIIVVDNGSDKCPPAKSANLLLPKNIRATGQAKIALMYCMSYFPADYYWLITTSTVLLDRVDYVKKIQEAFQDLREIEVGVLSPALDSNKAIATQRYTAENAKKQYLICFHPELVASLVSHKLLEKCREKKKAYFEKAFVRGWGCNYELLHEAVLGNAWAVIHHSMPVKWVSNLGYKKNVGGEDLESYFKNAGREMETTLTKKYGRNWYRKMFSLYVKKVHKLKFSYNIDREPNRRLDNLSHFGLKRLFIKDLSFENR